MRGLIQPRVVSFIDFVPMLRALLQLTAPRQIVASMHNNLKALRLSYGELYFVEVNPMEEEERNLTAIEPASSR